MDNFSIISYIDEEKISSVKKLLEIHKYKIFTINGINIVDLETFFKEIKNILPQDPILSGRVNLDALMDSLWGGFDNLGEEKVAIVWRSANNIINNNINQFLVIMDCFKELKIGRAHV